MTLDTTRVATLVAPAEELGEDVLAVPDLVFSTLSTFDFAVLKIAEQLRCTEDKAATGLRFIEKMVDKARAGNTRMWDTPGVHHLTAEEMADDGYPVMDEIMKHGEVSTPDSAHAAVEQHVLLPGEHSLVHDNPTGKKTDCQVALGIGEAA